MRTNHAAVSGQRIQVLSLRLRHESHQLILGLLEACGYYGPVRTPNSLGAVGHRFAWHIRGHFSI